MQPREILSTHLINLKLEVDISMSIIYQHHETLECKSVLLRTFYFNFSLSLKKPYLIWSVFIFLSQKNNKTNIYFVICRLHLMQNCQHVFLLLCVKTSLFVLLKCVLELGGSAGPDGFPFVSFSFIKESLQPADMLREDQTPTNLPVLHE